MATKIIRLNTKIRKNSGVDGCCEPPYFGDGGGNDMESRLVRLETLAEVTERRLTAIEVDVKEIRKEISSAKIWALILFGTGWASLVGIMAKGFGWIK